MSETEKRKEVKNLFDACTDKSNKIDRTELLEKINKEIQVFLSTETNEEDEAYKILGFLRDLSDSVQEEFEELVVGESDKKQLYKSIVKNLCTASKYKS